jgi:hypothetical protein
MHFYTIEIFGVIFDGVSGEIFGGISNGIFGGIFATMLSP